MILMKRCGFLEWAAISSLWVPSIVAKSSSTTVDFQSHLHAAIQHDAHKNVDEDESACLPAIDRLDTISNLGSDPNAKDVEDSGTLVASRSSRTESSTLSSRLRIGDPHLPPYSWGNLDDDITSIHERASIHEELNESLRIPLDQQVITEQNDRESSSDLDLDLDLDEAIMAQTESLGHSPIVYRYFGRSRARARSCDSIPFILLGPSVDHWKSVGQTLASRGFSVMACERVQEKDGDETLLIIAVLDALRWPRAILVGCDNESSLAIQAALELAPDRVAGLVLCGDLSSAESMLSRATVVSSGFALDKFLLENLECPFTIVWDGNRPHKQTARSVSAEAQTTANRFLILGGGSAPHRRQPEHFAWALTRFVEEKVVPPLSSAQFSQPSRTGAERKRFGFPIALDDIFTPGSFLVTGRVVANALLMASFGKVFLYQYEHFHQGMVAFQSRAMLVHSWPKRVLFAVFAFLFRRQESVDTDSTETDFQPATDGIDSSINSEAISADEEGPPGSESDEKAEYYNHVNDEQPGEETAISPYHGLMFLDQVVS